MNTLVLFAALAAASARIDTEAGILLGVSVITEGEARGHDMFIDATTLGQVRDCIAAFGDDGVKVKVNHWSGFEGIVGTLRNPRIDGIQLRADLHLLATHEARAKILEMAEQMPSQFGLSIAFSGESEEREVGSDAGQIKANFARCQELYSVDLVDDPAANPTGLFSNGESPERLFSAALLRIQTLESDLTALRGEATTLRTQLATAETELTTLRTEREKLTTLASRLKSAAHLAPAVVIPPVEPPNSGAPSDAELLAKYNALPPADRRPFYLEHKAALLRARSAAH